MPDGNGRTLNGHSKRAWAVFLLSSSSYLPGVLVLAHSLRKHRSRYPLIVLYNDKVPGNAIELLRRQGLECRRIEPLMPVGPTTLIAERFVDTWAKMRVFELVEYEVRPGRTLSCYES